MPNASDSESAIAIVKIPPITASFELVPELRPTIKPIVVIIPDVKPKLNPTFNECFIISVNNFDLNNSWGLNKCECKKGSTETRFNYYDCDSRQEEMTWK